MKKRQGEVEKLREGEVAKTNPNIFEVNYRRSQMTSDEGGQMTVTKGNE